MHLLHLRDRPFLAPLSMFTNLPFRLLCQKYGAKGAVVPLVSAKAICLGREPVECLDPHPSEKFVGVQLFGNEPQVIGDAARIVADRYPFIKFIDINCACPVRKVVVSGAGSALLHSPEKVREMIKAARKSDMPVTIKLRKCASKQKTLDFCKSCESAGAAALFVHGRSPSQGYSGEADWELVSSIAHRVSIPVIGSGDIRSMEQGERMRKESGCASFMIGRAALSDPGVFSSPTNATFERKKGLFMEYMKLCEDHKMVYLPDLRSKAIQLCNGFRNSAALRVKIGNSKSIEELLSALSQ